MKQVIITPPKQISAKDKEKLSKAGYIVIEAEEPEKVRFLAEQVYCNDDLLMSAIYAVRRNQFAKGDFVDELYKRIYQPKS